MSGMYLSADQNQNQDIVSDIVFLQRQDSQSDDEQIAIMHTTPRVLAVKESKEVQEHYDDFSNHSEEY
jgi:hypothetical protein